MSAKLWSLEVGQFYCLQCFAVAILLFVAITTYLVHINATKSYEETHIVQVVNWHCRKDENVIKVNSVEFIQCLIDDTIHESLECS